MGIKMYRSEDFRMYSRMTFCDDGCFDVGCETTNIAIVHPAWYDRVHMSITGRRFQRAATRPFVLGVTKPTAATTGLNVLDISPASLTTVSGNVYHSTDGAMFDRIRFTGKVTVQAKNITYRNCWFNGPYTSSTSLVSCTNAAVRNIVFENCKFSQSSFSTSPDTSPNACLFGHEFTL